jgi:hypothetical protein
MVSCILFHTITVQVTELADPVNSKMVLQSVQRKSEWKHITDWRYYGQPKMMEKGRF